MTRPDDAPISCLTSCRRHHVGLRFRYERNLATATDAVEACNTEGRERRDDEPRLVPESGSTLRSSPRDSPAEMRATRESSP